MAIEPPVLEEQLLNLSPRGRILAGPILLALGIATSIVFWGMGLIWYGSMFCVLFGPALLWSGLRDEARQRRFDAEVDRAHGEWHDLRRDLALAKRTGQNPARLLQERGYTVFSIRRWIVRELGDEPK